MIEQIKQALELDEAGLHFMLHKNAVEWLRYLIGEAERPKELDEENERLMQKLVEAHTLRGMTMIENQELQRELAGFREEEDRPRFRMDAQGNLTLIEEE